MKTSTTRASSPQRLRDRKILPGRLYCLLISLVLLLGGTQALADPQLQLNSEEQGQQLTFFITPETTSGCTHTLYGSRSRRKLNSNPTAQVLLQSVENSTKVIELFALDLNRIKSRKKKRISFYFMALEECDDVTTRTEIVRLRVKPLRKGKGTKIKRWLTELEQVLMQRILSVEEAFPGLTFTAPVDLQNAGDGTDRIFVVEQGGVVSVFENSPDVSTRSTFLDISDLVIFGGERGLLGLAFHPDYENNGFFYLHYTRTDDGTIVIARYKVSDSDPNQADPSSATTIMTIEHPGVNHNGGQIAFGPDGFLYIALGDGGGGGDPLANGQDPTTLLGSILRIDVDNTSGQLMYSIPSTNPFVGNQSNFREEIYAYGLRNPWRFSFDPVTGLLWLGDVGQNQYEEINIIQSGGNYGWNTMEGASCFQAETCDQTGLTLPVAFYDHQSGRSVTGGYVYRGTTVTEFIGKYVSGDFNRGIIWLLDDENDSTLALTLDLDLLISAFGVDEAQELYFLAYGQGKVYKFTDVAD